MSKIRIKKFGPIRTGCLSDDGWVDIRKVTLFIGNQGSGKSSVAKLISTFSWIEKALVRGDHFIEWFTQKDVFRKKCCSYHRLENYFFDLNGNDIAEIEYQGDAYSMSYDKGDFSIKETKNGPYSLPQIMYVPAERNFISTVKSPQLLKLSSESLIEFLTEFDRAKHKVKNKLRLPINNTDITYDKTNDSISILGDKYKVLLTEASSGFQSVVPLFIVSWYLTNSIKQHPDRKSESSDEKERFRKGVEEIWKIKGLTHEQRRAALSVLSSKFNKSAFIYIVEEPEQNLFPSSQREMVNSLLAFNNEDEGNKLVMTTHSPYIVNYLSIAIQGHYLSAKIISPNDHGQLNKIVPKESLIAGKDVVVYQLDETDGSIKKLADFEGIPSDQNYLNQSLVDGNVLFDSLLEIEQITA